MVADIEPDIIGITESWAHKDMVDTELMLPGYVMFRKDRQERMGGGVIMYIKDSIQAYELQMVKEAECEEAIWCNIATKNSTLTIGLIYRSPNIRQEDDEKLHNAIKEISKRECVIMGDFNHGHIQWKSLESVGRDDQQFLLLIQDCFLTQHVLDPTRGGNVLDLVFSSQNELVDNVKICEPLGSSDHNQIHFSIKIQTEITSKKRGRRNFNKGKYKQMRTYLASTNWTYLMKDNTATECWIILKDEIEGIIETFVPIQNQGKRSRKKHLSKEAIRKIAYKQIMWRIYRNTGNIEDYNNYKKALNLATAEMRKSKRSFEQKLANDIIKNNNKSFYAYVRSKQKVRDKVGPLKNSAGNVISDGFQMAEDLNEYFSSVFTKEDISSLPLPARKLNKMMKTNKSPGVDGITPKLLKEIVNEISTPLANFFNISLKEGIVPAEWKEANVTPLFKKGSRSKTEHYRLNISIMQIIRNIY